jgi:small subunit ribosomal protein S16
MPNEQNEKLVALKLDRIRYWLGVGAQPTNPVAKLLGLAGVLPVHPRSYLEAARSREARLKTLEDTQLSTVEDSRIEQPVDDIQ